MQQVYGSHDAYDSIYELIAHNSVDLHIRNAVRCAKYRFLFPTIPFKHISGYAL